VRVDTHVHSSFSIDGRATLDAMAEAAFAKGFDAVCFTEHFDLNPLDSGTGFFDYDAFSRAVDEARGRCASRIEILKGLEFSEPHRYPAALERFNRMDFDFILGSVHWIGDDWIGDPDYVRRTALEDIYARHYEETLAACESGGFDSLAHADFPKRYLEGKVEPRADLLAALMAALASKGIALELNSSPLRKGRAERYPSDLILGAYLAAGGRAVTFSSDAHRTEDLGADFDRLDPPAACEPCFFRARKRVAIGAPA